MPPKRKNAKGTKRKNAATDVEPEPKLARADSVNTQLKKAIEAVQKENPKTKSTAKLDKVFSGWFPNKAKPVIHEDYACMLNQTDVINNNNKYYVIQVAAEKNKFYLFTRWGRVGEVGQHSVEEHTSAEKAVNGFEKKFQAKTGNSWEKRDKFTAKPKKYTLLEMDDASDDEEDESGVETTVVKKTTGDSSVPCKLDMRTQIMIDLIFNSDMFVNQMAQMDLDVKKMPLGKLSKVQIAKGLQALIELEEAVKGKSDRNNIALLSSKFFTLVPHNFGRSVPPILNSESLIQQKKDMMMTLSDIELAQTLQNVKSEPDVEHPLDVNYKSLKCEMKLLDRKSKDFKIIQDYVNASQNNYCGAKPKLTDVWILDREGEGNRFAINDDLNGRKLLWHGTSVAVVAAILNSGLRIMPHSGGRVGRGIYLASEYSKSAGYASGFYGTFKNEKNTTFLFLSEVALGNPKEIAQDNSSLRAAPKGFDSVIARGRCEPDPKKDVKIKLEGNEVVVPVGAPVNQKKWANSSFWQSEYLVYNEHQVRLRYLVKFTS